MQQLEAAKGKCEMELARKREKMNKLTDELKDLKDKVDALNDDLEQWKDYAERVRATAATMPLKSEPKV
jgi:predicted nuclease with TOPRIM domain